MMRKNVKKIPKAKKNYTNGSQIQGPKGVIFSQLLEIP